MYFYYGVQVLDSTTDEPIIGIGVEMNSPDEEGNWVTSECQWTTDGDGYAWGCWNLNYNPQNVTAGAGGEGTGYNYNSIDVGPVSDAAWNGTDSISTQLHLSASQVTPPTFTDQTKSVNLAPTSATVSPIVNVGAFTAATAARGGSITYQIISVTNQTNAGQNVTGWTLGGNTGQTTSMQIRVPAQTPGAQTFAVLVRATETANNVTAYTDATITVTVNKRTPTLTISSASSTIKYPNSTTFTITGGTYYGTLSVTSNYPTRVQASRSGTTITLSTASSTATGAARISVTSAATDYDKAVTASHTATCQAGDGTPPLFTNSTVEVTLAATNATTSPYRGCPNFNAASATHGGGITYQIVSVEDETGNTQTVGTSAWSINGSVSFTSARIIRVPAQTSKGVYYVVINAREAAAGMYGESYKEATITVNVLGTPQNAPTALGELSQYAASGTITGSASGGGGIGTLYYKSDTNGGTNYGTATTTAPSRSKTSIGTTTFVAYWSGNDFWAQSPDSSQASLVITKRTGAAPTFNNQPVTATLAPTAPTTSPAVNAGAFTAASAGHGGTITGYAIQSVNGGSVGSWSINSSRQIVVPASTSGGTYTIVVRATEAETATDTESYKDATITVTVNKKANPMTISPTSATIYDRSGYNTVQITPSGNIGTVTYSSNATSKATVSSSGLVTYAGAGSATITVSDPGNNYWDAGSKTCTVTTVVDTVTYGNLTITTSPASTQSVAARGTQTTGGVQQPIEVKVTACSQTLTWASGYSETLTDPSTLTVSCAVTTAKTGFSLDTTTTPNTVSVTNNTSTTARNGFVVTLTATGQGSKTASQAITFNQLAGSQVYANPTVTYTYATFSAAGGTNGPSTLSYSQTYTWNSVTGSGGTITTGATVSYASDSSLYPTGFSVASDFETTGRVTYASRGTTPGAILNARTALSVTVTLNGKTKTQNPGACQQQANYRTWGNVTFTISPDTPYQMAAAGETKLMSISATQTATFTSGATDSYTPSTSAEVTTAATGFSMSHGRTGYSVIATNNTSTSARGNFVVTVTGTGITGTNSTYDTGYNKTGTSARTFTQAAGAKVYANPTVLTYAYTTFAATGATKTPTAPTYSQSYTWNGVAGDGGTETTGGTLSYSTTSILHSGFSTATNFATTGNVTWANNTTTSSRDAADTLKVTVTMNGKTSSAFTCTSCVQSAGAQVYANPVVNTYTYSTSVSAAGVTDLSPASLTYSQDYTWNGVSGSGGTITTGGTLAFTRTTTYSWMTAGTNFATTGKINVAARGKYTDYRDFYSALSVTVTLNGKTSTSKTCTAGRQSGNTYTDAWNNPSVSTYSYSNIGAAGGTSSPSVTATQSGTRTWANSAGTDTLSNTTFTYGYSMTTGNGFSINTSTGVITAEARGKYTTTRTSNTATVTVTGNGKSGTKTATCTQSGNTYTDSWNNPSVTAYTYASITAAGGTSSPSVTATQSGTRTWANSAGTDTLSNSTFTYAYSMTSGSGFSINTSTGVITVDGRGTTIGNARTSNTATVTVTGSGSKTGTKTATCTQEGNYVTAITPRASSGTTHFKYNNITAGATSASPTLTGAATYTFSSGSTSTSAPVGGIATYTRTYSLGAVQNGFTAVNATSGVLTATNRAKNTGAARTSGTVTSDLVVTFVHDSTYSAGGTVTSSIMTSTATCTQAANYLSWDTPTLTVSAPATPYSMSMTGETKEITATTSTQTGTYTSGSTDTYTPPISYTVKTAVSGYTLTDNSVTVGNNTTTSARNGFVVTVTATGKTGTNSTYVSGLNQTTTSDRTFNQSAGAKVYSTPTVTEYKYSTTANTGYTDKPVWVITYEMPYTWNGVAADSGTDTSGGTLAYSCASGTPARFSTGTNFATTGKITWGNNNTTSTKNARTYLTVTVTTPTGNLTSEAFTCTACAQSAGSKVYSTPTVNTYTYADTNAAGATNKTPNSITYSLPYTWNGVSADSGTDTTGGTLAYTCGSGTPTGFSTGTNFATTGAITWASRGTTPGSALDAKSYLSVTVTKGSYTSEAKTCTACTQTANALTGLSMSVGSNPISYNTKTSVTVTASYTSGASKDVSGDSNTTYDDTSNPDIVEFNKTEILS